MLLPLEGQLLTVIEHHGIDLTPFEGGEHIILIRRQELIRGSTHVIGRRESEVTLRELLGKVLLLVEGIGHLTLVVVLIGLPSSCHIALQEPVLVEVGGGLRTQTGTQSVDIVAGDNRIDGTDIRLRGVACLDIVLDECLQTYHDILEALHLLEALDEVLHGSLTFGQIHVPVTCPEEVAMRQRLRVPDIPFSLEQLVVKLVEGIVGQSRIADDDHLLQEAQYLHLHHHIVNSQHPLACRQLRELLDDTQVLHEVDTTLPGNGDVAPLHLIAGVLEDIDITAETEVLQVIRKEMQVYTTVPLNLQGVLDIETVEADGSPADR